MATQKAFNPSREAPNQAPQGLPQYPTAKISSSSSAAAVGIRGGGRRVDEEEEEECGFGVEFRGVGDERGGDGGFAGNGHFEPY